MVPKTSDSEMNDASSSQLQPTETMETSAGLVSPVPEMRKAETPNTTGESKSERESESDEEDEYSNSDWDKDSFDGVEYDPSSDDGKYVNEEYEKRMRSYHRSVIETKGFFKPSDKYPPYMMFCYMGFSSLRDLEERVRGITIREFLRKMVSLCVEKYNRRKEKKVKLEQILWANYIPGGRTRYYITFSARESESPNAPLVEFQAKAIRFGGKVYPILCRPSPPPKTSQCAS